MTRSLSMLDVDTALNTWHEVIANGADYPVTAFNLNALEDPNVRNAILYTALSPVGSRYVYNSGLFMYDLPKVIDTSKFANAITELCRLDVEYGEHDDVARAHLRSLSACLFFEVNKPNMVTLNLEGLKYQTDLGWFILQSVEYGAKGHFEFAPLPSDSDSDSTR